METPIEESPVSPNKRLVSLEWKHYIYEFLIVVLGISVPFVLSKFNEYWVQKETEKQYYKSIFRELEQDVEELKGNKEENEEQIQKFRFASQLIGLGDKSQADTLGRLALEIKNFSDFKRNGTIYQTLAQSGELDNFENKEVLIRLQKLDELYNYMNRLENNHTSLIMEFYPKILQYIRIKPFQVVDSVALFDFRFQNHFEVLILIMEEKSKLYQQSIENAQEIAQILEKKTH